MKKLISTYVLLMFLCVHVSHEIHAQNSLSAIKSRSQEHGDGIALISFDEFLSFFTSARRDFNAFVLLTSEDCRACAYVLQNLEPLFDSLTKLRQNPALAASQSAKEALRTYAVVSMISKQDLVTYRSQLQAMGITHSPFLIYIPKSQPIPPRAGQFPEALTFPFRSQMPETDILSDWMSSASGFSVLGKQSARFGPSFFGVTSYPTLAEVMTKLQPFLLILVPLVFLLAVIFGWYKLPQFYYTLMLVFYAMSTSGLFYVILRNPPFAVWRTTQWEWISAGLRSMYVAEGWVAAAGYVSCGLCLVAAVEGPPALILRALSSSVTTITGNTPSTSATGKDPLWRMMCSIWSLLLISMAALIASGVLSMFDLKFRR
uniref:Uncharacterized protein n=1 Tax=Timspurckia oligopyrenoides TaxID=708627 RepID=A0A6T6LEW5_9RHOD|mmetsp:Transcript_11670/g.21127  ORF Transcript_11670/g.21127 Transcript_11670/m.21127 type:complete len:374 (+) Transcript_11670:1723-2844(+)